MSPKECDSVRKAIEGDKEAYGALIDTYQGMVFATALNITGNFADSEDVVQEAFIRAYQKLRTLSDPSKFAAWLHTVARRIALQLLKDKRRVPGVHASDVPMDLIESDAESPAEAYAREELSNLLWGEVGQLPPKTREAVLLFYMEGFSIKRAASYLNVSENAMKARLNFGRQKLREQLTSKMEDELRGGHSPRKTRHAIIAALPAMPLPVPQTSLLGGAKALSVLALSSKALVGVAVVAILAIAALFAARQLRPGPAQTPVVPVPVQSVEQDTYSDEGETSVVSSESAPAALPVSVAEAGKGFIAGAAVEKTAQTPVEGLPLELHKDGKVVAATKTDDLGKFKFADLDKGRYELRALVDAPGILANYYLVKGQRSISVNLSGASVENLVIKLQSASSISGIVLDENDKAVPGAALRLKHYEHNPVRPSVDSGSDGTFVFHGVLPTVSYGLSARAPGYSPVEITGLVVEPGRVLEGVVVKMAKGEGATIIGHVFNKSGQPVENASVHMYSSRENNDNFVSDSGGRFAFYNLVPGNVSLDMELYDEHLTLTLDPNEVRDDVEFIVDQEILAGYVSGVIVDADGKAITKGNVGAQRPGILEVRGNSRDIGWTSPNEYGEFQVANLKSGSTVDIVYRGPSGPRKTTSASGILVSTEGLVVIFSPGKEEQRRVNISGRVLDKETRRPIEQFGVCGSHSDYRASGSPAIVYSPDGRFRLDNVRPYRYLYAEAEGYAPVFVPTNIAKSSDEAEVEVLMERGGSIEGRVLNVNGVAVAGAHVSINGMTRHSTVTDARGKFGIAGIGRFGEMTVKHVDYAAYVGTPYGGSDEVRNCEIRLSSGASVEGFVLDAQGQAVAKSRVGVYGIGNGTPFLSAYTDATGSYRIDLIRPDTYRMKSDGHEGEDTNVTLVEGEVGIVDFGPVGSMVYGTVYLQGRPMASANMLLSDTPNPSDGWARLGRGTTEMDGSFVFHNVPFGKHYVIACERWRRKGYAVVEVSAGQDVQQDIIIECGSISGRVVEGDGTSINEARVALFDKEVIANMSPMQARASVSATSSSDAQGAFNFNEVPAGDYMVQAFTDDFAQSSVDVSVSANQSIADVVIVLESGGKLEVTTVHAETGKPIESNGALFMLDEDGRLSYNGLRPHSGGNSALLTGINPGVYQAGCLIEDDRDNRFCSAMSTVVDVRAAVKNTVKLRMFPATKAEIKVVDFSQGPVTDFRVEIFDSAGAPFVIMEREMNLIKTWLPFGKVRLVLLGNNDDTLYDGEVAVTQPPSSGRFETTVVVE